MPNKSIDNSLKSIIKGNIVGGLLFVILIIISAAALLRLNLTDEYYLPLYVGSLIISSLIPSVLTVLKHKKRGLIYGIAVSVFPSIIAFVSTCVASKGFSLIYLFIPLISIISSALAGITAVNIKTKKRRR